MRVLVGIEGSEESTVVLENAIARAEEAGDELTFALFAKPEGGQALDEIEVSVRDALTEADIEGTIRRLETGDPASELVAMAERDGFDQLVVGGGRDTPLGKRYLGRITEFALLNAEVTVRLER